MLYIEPVPVTRKETQECSAMRKIARGDLVRGINDVEEVQCCKRLQGIRALR